MENESPPSEVESRLTGLEIKLSYTEDLFDQLDKVVIRQQQQIDALIREIADLRQPATDRAAAQARAQPHGLRDDLPPHF